LFMRGAIFSDEWQIIRGWLPGDLEERARRHRMIRHGCKPLEAGGWLRLILMHVAGGLSLEQTTVRAKELGWAEITDVALLKRLAQAYAWLVDLTEYLLSEQRRQLDPRDWSCAYRLRVIDATDITEPGSIGTDWRLHYSIRLPELVCDHYELTDCHGGEKLGRFGFEPGELVLVDAGYSHRGGVAHLLEAGAQVLGRWNALGFPLEHPSGRALAPLSQLRSLALGQCAEWPVQFRDGPAVYRLRLCALRKSPEDTEQARRKLFYNATRKGKRADPLALRLCAYVLLLTSVSPEVLSTQAVLDLYRGRWQIELVFKRFKSLLGGGHVPKTSDASALAWMQAKILIALLLERVLLEGHFLSPELLCPDEVSRWRIVLEVRDCLQRVLAPPLSLPHLLHRGCAIASASRTGRPKRPLQMTQIRKIFATAQVNDPFEIMKKIA
jgi:hypothetical protein